MAKKQTEALAVITEALAVIDDTPNELATAAYADGDVRGKEGITQDDLLIPRLAIAQKMSPQLDPEKAQFIDGLKEGDLYNTLTEEVYGQPVRFVPIMPVRKHAKVLDAAGKVLEWNVPFDSPRCEFTEGPNKTRTAPEATRFYDFLVLVEGGPDFPVVLSMKRTQVPAAKALMSLQAQRPGPIFASAYRLTTVSQEGPKGKFKNFKVNPAGAPSDDYAARAEAWYVKLQTTKFTVDESEAGNESASNIDHVPF